MAISGFIDIKTYIAQYYLFTLPIEKLGSKFTIQFYNLLKVGIALSLTNFFFNFNFYCPALHVFDNCKPLQVLFGSFNINHNENDKP